MQPRVSQLMSCWNSASCIDRVPLVSGSAGLAGLRLSPCHAAIEARNRAKPASLLPRRCFGKRRSEEHTSELQSQSNLVCRLLLEKKKNNKNQLCGAVETVYRP